jgi:hypothetical protein
MAEPLYLDVTDAPEGAELARTMRRHGLTAGLVRAGLRWRVEVSSPHEDPRSFLSDVGVALASWTGPGSIARRLRSVDGAGWAADLDADGPDRAAALVRLRALLIAVAWFELERRRPDVRHLTSAQVARLVRDAGEQAYRTLLCRLADYHGQSRFEVWAAKFAIHELAAAARRHSATGAGNGTRALRTLSGV